MAKILQFKKPQPQPQPQPTFSERVENVRRSLDNINKLMAELKDLSKKNHR